MTPPDDGTDGDGHSFTGSGFGTLQPASANGRRRTPPVVSSRGSLRGGLPAVYRDEDFAMRFVGALERVLDPVVAVLDNLDRHFDPDVAPEGVLRLISAWLGVDLDESLSPAERRETVRRAAELGRRRGTLRGMELALRLTFPQLPLRVEDRGGVGWSLDPDAQAEPAPARFVVYCDAPLPPETQTAIARCIERFKPVHTSYRLRVRSARPQA
jgi:phage tail-like protein